MANRNFGAWTKVLADSGSGVPFHRRDPHGYIQGAEEDELFAQYAITQGKHNIFS